MPLVKIKPGLSHGYYDAATGSHAYHQAGDEFDASPAEMESFGDKFIPVIEIESPVGEIVDEPGLVPGLVKGVMSWTEVVATPAARRLAQEHGVGLAWSGIVGSGKDGRITKADVEALLNGDAE